MMFKMPSIVLTNRAQFEDKNRGIEPVIKARMIETICSHFCANKTLSFKTGD